MLRVVVYWLESWSSARVVVYWLESWSGANSYGLGLIVVV